MDLGAHVMIDLVVQLVKVCWRCHVEEATSDVVSKKKVWVRKKGM